MWPERSKLRALPDRNPEICDARFRQAVKMEHGIAAHNRHNREQAERFGVEIIEARAFRDEWRPIFERPVYISIDLDAFDPAFAPGVSHHEPGGLSVRQVVNILLDLNVPIIGADVVELNPDRDVNGVTAVLAAKLVKELAAAMTANGS